MNVREKQNELKYRIGIAYLSYEYSKVGVEHDLYEVNGSTLKVKNKRGEKKLGTQNTK
jgi:hypothetical protein